MLKFNPGQYMNDPHPDNSRQPHAAARTPGQSVPGNIGEQARQVARSAPALPEKQLVQLALEFDREDPCATVRRTLRIPDGRIRAESHTLGPPTNATVGAAREVLDQWEEFGVRAWSKDWSGGTAGWMEIMPALQKNLAEILGANPDQVLLRATLTENLATALRMLHRPVPGQQSRRKILAHDLMFPSDVDAIHAELDYHRLSPEDDLLRVTPSGSRGVFSTRDFIEALERHKNEAGLLVFEHQPYLTGQVLDAEAITRAAKKLGYFVIIDAAHSAGIYPINARQIGADCMIGCCYKEILGGPGTVGWIYVDVDRLNSQGIWMPRGWWGRSPEARFQFGGAYVPDRGALRLQLSTPSPILQNMVAASLASYEQVGGIQTVYAQAIQRVDLFLAVLKKHPNFGTAFGLISPESGSERSGEISLFFSSGDECLQLAEALAEMPAEGKAFDVDTRRAFYDEQEGVMRIGFHPFTLSHEDAVHAAIRFVMLFDTIHKAAAI